MNNVLVCLCHNNHRHIAGIIHLIGLNPDHSQLPLRVHIVCTAAGFSLLKNSIFTDNDGWLWELRNSFPNDKILISHENIHLIQQGNRTVHDISSKDSSQAAAEAIHSLINNLCSTKQGRIYSVMSPGNMILNSFLHLAMEKYARPDDSLYYYLSEPFFRNHPEFYFPDQQKKELTWIQRTTGKAVTCKTAKAHTCLLNIPLMRHESNALMQVKSTLSSHDIDTSKNIFVLWNKLKGLLSCNEREVFLTPVESAIYAQLVDAKTSCSMDVSCAGCSLCYLRPYEINVNLLLRHLRDKWGELSGRVEIIETRLRENNNFRDWFLQHRSRINRKIRRAELDSSVLIACRGEYGEARYGIEHDKNIIRAV